MRYRFGWSSVRVRPGDGARCATPGDEGGGSLGGCGLR